MSTPTQTQQTDPALTAAVAELKTSVATLTTTVQTLMATVTAVEKRLHLVYTAVVLVVGVIGGPNAVAALTGH